MERHTSIVQSVGDLDAARCDPLQLFLPTSQSIEMLRARLQRPHLLQVLDDGHVGIHITVDAVLHAGFLAAVKLALRDPAGDALAEASIHSNQRRCSV